VYTTIGTSYSFLHDYCPGIGFQSKHDNRQPSKRIRNTNCCIHTFLPPDDEPRHDRNMYRLTKYTMNYLCIKLVSFLQDCIEMQGQQNMKKKHEFNPTKFRAKVTVTV
jgi:hypothetical protein